MFFSSFNIPDQPFSQIQYIHRSEAFQAWMVYSRMSGLRAAVPQGVEPLGWNSLPTLHSAKKRATDGGVGISVY